MPYTGKRRGTMETYRNEEQMQCLAKSEGCSTLPVSLYLADRVSITGAQAALAVMLSMSLVGSLAKLEVFSENTRQMKMTTEQRCSKERAFLSGGESAMRKSIIIRGCNLLLESL